MLGVVPDKSICLASGVEDIYIAMLRSCCALAYSKTVFSMGEINISAMVAFIYRRVYGASCSLFWRDEVNEVGVSDTAFPSRRQRPCSFRIGHAGIR